MYICILTYACERDRVLNCSCIRESNPSPLLCAIWSGEAPCGVLGVRAHLLRGLSFT